jgi:hypothetical protein
MAMVLQISFGRENEMQTWKSPSTNAHRRNRAECDSAEYGIVTSYDSTHRTVPLALYLFSYLKCLAVATESNESENVVWVCVQNGSPRVHINEPNQKSLAVGLASTYELLQP